MMEEYEKMTPAEIVAIVQKSKEGGHKVDVQTSWFGDDDFESYGPDVEVIRLKKKGEE